MIDTLTQTEVQQIGVVPIGSSAVLGNSFRIGDDWWQVIQHSRMRIVMKRIQSELHAIRLTLGKSQHEMKKAFGISQAQYCRYETGIYPAPEQLMAQARAMLPNDQKLSHAERRLP